MESKLVDFVQNEDDGGCLLGIALAQRLEQKGKGLGKRPKRLPLQLLLHSQLPRDLLQRRAVLREHLPIQMDHEVRRPRLVCVLFRELAQRRIQHRRFPASSLSRYQLRVALGVRDRSIQ